MGRVTHGRTKTTEFSIWSGMRKRCNCPTNRYFEDYGGRGIKICERWESFENFYVDMGPRPSLRHTIDRIDNDKGYEPGNCRWATMDKQANNRRSSHLIEHNGVTRTLAEWAREYGLRSGTLLRRISQGWPPHIAFTAPLKRGRWHNV